MANGTCSSRAGSFLFKYSSLPREQMVDNCWDKYRADSRDHREKLWEKTDLIQEARTGNIDDMIDAV
jgi:hypothetical protein